MKNDSSEWLKARKEERKRFSVGQWKISFLPGAEDARICSVRREKFNPLISQEGEKSRLVGEMMASTGTGEPNSWWEEPSQSCCCDRARRETRPFSPTMCVTAAAAIEEVRYNSKPRLILFLTLTLASIVSPQLVLITASSHSCPLSIWLLCFMQTTTLSIFLSCVFSLCFYIPIS